MVNPVKTSEGWQSSDGKFKGPRSEVVRYCLSPEREEEILPWREPSNGLPEVVGETAGPETVSDLDDIIADGSGADAVASTTGVGAETAGVEEEPVYWHEVDDISPVVLPLGEAGQQPSFEVEEEPEKESEPEEVAAETTEGK